MNDEFHLVENNDIQKTDYKYNITSINISPPPETTEVVDISEWINQFQTFDSYTKINLLEKLLEHCDNKIISHFISLLDPCLRFDFTKILPKEMSIKIFSYLNQQDLNLAYTTCKSWMRIINDDILWKSKLDYMTVFIDTLSIHQIFEIDYKINSTHIDGCYSPTNGYFLGSSVLNNERLTYKNMYFNWYKYQHSWKSQCFSNKKILKGHDGHVITCLQFDNDVIVTGSDDSTLRIWDRHGNLKHILIGHLGGVWAAQIHSGLVISGSTDRSIRLWNIKTGFCHSVLVGHLSTVRCLATFGSKVVSGSRDNNLRLWDLRTGECLRIFVGHFGAVRCVEYNGQFIISGAYDSLVKVWSENCDACLYTLQGHSNRIYSLYFDGKFILSGSIDSTVCVWDVHSGKKIHTLIGHKSLTSGMAVISPTFIQMAKPTIDEYNNSKNISLNYKLLNDEQDFTQQSYRKHLRIVTANADCTLKIWSMETGSCLFTSNGPNKHLSAITTLQVVDGFIVTSSDDGSVKLWSANDLTFIRDLLVLENRNNGGVVWRVKIDKSSFVCATGSRNNTEETKIILVDLNEKN